VKENSIEEDIKILERFSNENVIYGSTVGMTLEKYKNLQLSIKHILSDYKKLQEDFEQIDHECNRLEEKEFKLENKINKLKNEMQKDKMEQFDDYVIYLIEKYLKILEK